MGRFYETTFFDEGPVFIGWQLLASPAEVGGEAISYDQLLEGVDKQAVSVDDRQAIYSALATTGTAYNLRYTREGPDISANNIASEVPFDYLEKLLDAPFFAIEASPLRARTLTSVLALATSGYLIMTNHHPALVLLGDGLGLVVIRPLTAIGGAMWEGARDEVKEFGGDVAAKQLNAIRSRLGIPKRKKRK